MGVCRSTLLPTVSSRPRNTTWVGDLVYGANDGILTTFAVVAGVTGGALSAAAVGVRKSRRGGDGGE